MFDIFFGWRKASKWYYFSKRLIKRVRCRLKLLKNKRFTIVKQLREDRAQLIKLGYQDAAFNRAEQLLKDENIMAVYDMLDKFCEFVNIQLPYIRKHKGCPNDINEAVSSSIFASARCADLPELPTIRKLFGERYGHRFAKTAVELLPGNLVNREIQEKLSIKSVSDDVKYRLIHEIARDYHLQPEILALEYFPEWQRQASDGNEMEGKSVQVDPLAQKDPPLIVDSPSNRQTRNIGQICTTTSKQKDDDERIKAPSSPESSPRFSELVVYLDDIEELESSMRKEAYSQDQRLFKFKSLSLPTKRVVVDDTDGDDESYTDSESQDDEPSPSRNKSRRRKSFSLERSSMKDVDQEIYYENHKNKSHHYRKVLLKRPKQPCKFHDREEKFSPRNQRSGQFAISVAEETSDEKFCHVGCRSSLPSVGRSHTRQGTIGPYLRATTMPQETPREIHRYNIVRSNSLSIHNPNHVHPKLPEYEDIAAKFMALKKERLLHN